MLGLVYFDYPGTLLLFMPWFYRKSLTSEAINAVGGMFQRLRVREDPIRLGSCSVIKHLLTRFNCVNYLSFLAYFCVVSL